MEKAIFSEQDAQNLNMIITECRNVTMEIFKKHMGKIANITGGPDNVILLILLQLPATFFHSLCVRNNLPDMEMAKKDFIEVARFELERVFRIGSASSNVTDAEVVAHQDNFK